MKLQTTHHKKIDGNQTAILLLGFLNLQQCLINFSLYNRRWTQQGKSSRKKDIIRLLIDMS